MIDVNAYPILERHRSTLAQTSWDNKNRAYMTTSTLDAINFDDVKGEYIKGLGLSDTPSSVDALYVDKKGYVIFVEFKNGYIDNTEKYSVQKKIYDSMLILGDITSIHISDMRKRAVFILVYNDQANERSRDKEYNEKKKAVQPSSAYDKLAKTVSGYAGKEYVCFGLRMFEKYCFQEVHTYNQEEFEEYLKTY